MSELDRKVRTFMAMFMRAAWYASNAYLVIVTFVERPENSRQWLVNGGLFLLINIGWFFLVRSCDRSAKEDE